MRRKRKPYMLLALLLAVMSSVTVYSSESLKANEDATIAPYFVVEGDNTLAEQFPLKETQVTTNINGVIADIYVVQTYANEGKKPINASYVFPASTGVSIHGMTMEIGDNLVTAKIAEREEAKQEFEEAKSEGKSASLLEQQRPNVFTMDVANIMPGDTVRIELHYTELIKSAEGVYQFVFPTVVGPRYSNQSKSETSDQWVASPYLMEGSTTPGEYGITVNLSAGVPITSLTCKTHKVDVAWEGESSAKVTLTDTGRIDEQSAKQTTSPGDFAGNRDFILDYKLTGQELNSGLMLHTGEEENFFMLMVQPPERVKLDEIPPREYIFVLDVSGSMYGYPIDTAKELIKNLIARLRETDKFNLILFSGTSSLLSPKSVPATEAYVKSAINLIDNQTGGGGTELGLALEKAVSIPKIENYARSVIIITDGYIAEEDAIFDIIDENLSNTNFFSFGIGYGVNRHLTDGIAKAGQGESFVVTEAEEAEAAAERFRTYIQSPVLTDIKVTYDGFDVYDIEPSNMPTLFAQRPIVVYGKWRGEPSGSVRISGKIGDKEYVQEIKVSDAEPQESNTAVGYMWARARVGRLSDYGGINQADDIRKEVTAIGLKYSMMTEYTSFIAVIDKVRNHEKESMDVNQPLTLPLNVSNFAVGGYTIGSEPDMLLPVPVMLLPMFVCALYRKRRKNATF